MKWAPEESPQPCTFSRGAHSAYAQRDSELNQGRGDPLLKNLERDPRSVLRRLTEEVTFPRLSPEASAKTFPTLRSLPTSVLRKSSTPLFRPDAIYPAAKAEVQCGQRVAWIATEERQNGQSFIGATGGFSLRFR
jgi:hypothetical protein